jgi:UTP-glucose-1-phosphate uridylyltransferase
MWGIIPSAGAGSRIQPLAFSKELLPVGSRLDVDTERPRAVSEYLVERMLTAGAKKLCFVISHGKSDILEYYGGRIGKADISYVVLSGKVQMHVIQNGALSLRWAGFVLKKEAAHHHRPRPD